MTSKKVKIKNIYKFFIDITLVNGESFRINPLEVKEVEEENMSQQLWNNIKEQRIIVLYDKIKKEDNKRKKGE